jgi:hypothetical protein
MEEEHLEVGRRREVVDAWLAGRLRRESVGFKEVIVEDCAYPEAEGDDCDGDQGAGVAPTGWPQIGQKRASADSSAPHLRQKYQPRIEVIPDILGWLTIICQPHTRRD